MNPPRFAFFGTPEFATIILNELEHAGFLPALVVTAPDKPKGRKLIMSPSEVKEWACAHNIPVLTPEKIRDEAVFTALKKAHCDLFVVAAYGKIIPQALLDLPSHGVLNVHPSLLPKFRGPSPIEAAILSDETETGVSIMALDPKLDHGPIVAQEKVLIAPWPPLGSQATRILAHEGGKLLAKTIPDWLTNHTATPQDHSQATFTTKITKENGLIDLAGNPLQNYKKIRAFDDWPGAYFFVQRNGKNTRVRITDAKYEDGKLVITRVLPEGKKEMPYEDFLRGAQAQ